MSSMLSAQRPPLVALLDRQQLTLVSTATEQIFPITIAEDIVSDLTVLSPTGLLDQLKVTLRDQLDSELGLVIVLSPTTYFYHDFPGEDPHQAFENAAVVHFFDLVPFDNIVKIIVPNANGFAVVAANKDLYQPFFDAFAQLGFTAVGLWPWFVFFDESKVQFGFDVSAAKEVLKHMDALRASNLLAEIKGWPGGKGGPLANFKPVGLEKGQTKTNNPGYQPSDQFTVTSRVLMLGGIFGFLLLVLAGLIYVQMTQ